MYYIIIESDPIYRWQIRMEKIIDAQSDYCSQTNYRQRNPPWKKIQTNLFVNFHTNWATQPKLVSIGTFWPGTFWPEIIKYYKFPEPFQNPKYSFERFKCCKCICSHISAKNLKFDINGLVAKLLPRSLELEETFLDYNFWSLQVRKAAFRIIESEEFGHIKFGRNEAEFDADSIYD
jgi:hypothetical protein